MITSILFSQPIWLLQNFIIHLHRQNNITMTYTYHTYEHIDLRINDLILEDELNELDLMISSNAHREWRNNHISKSHMKASSWYKEVLFSFLQNPLKNKYSAVAQLARVSDCLSEGCGFESRQHCTTMSINLD